MSSSEGRFRVVFHTVRLVANLYEATLKTSAGNYPDAAVTAAKAVVHGFYLWKLRSELLALGGHLATTIKQFLKKAYRDNQITLPKEHPRRDEDK